MAAHPPARLPEHWRVPDRALLRAQGTVADKVEGLYADLLASFIIHPNQSVPVGWSQSPGGELLTPREWTQRGGLVKLSYNWRL